VLREGNLQRIHIQNKSPMSINKKNLPNS